MATLVDHPGVNLTSQMSAMWSLRIYNPSSCQIEDTKAFDGERGQGNHGWTEFSSAAPILSEIRKMSTKKSTNLQTTYEF